MKTLFDRPLAHTQDPLTSFEAGVKRLNSSWLNGQEYRVYAVIANYGGENFTAKELSERSGLNYWMIQRRLSDLKNEDLIERTGGRRDGCAVWALKGGE